MANEQQKPESLSDLLQAIVERAEDEEQVTFGDLLDALHTRSYGPVLLLPAIVAVSPIGMIPGASIVCGSIIALLSMQMVFGLKHPWLPERLKAFEFPHDKIRRGVNKSLPIVRRFEKFLGKRLRVLSQPPFTRLVALLCLVLAVLFYPLALLPFAVALPGTAIVLLSLGLTARDGVLVLVGIVTSGVTGWLSYAFWPF